MASHSHDVVDVRRPEVIRTNNRAAPRVGGLYDRFVSLMRITLPAIALALTIIVVLWPALNPSEFSFLLAVDKVQLSPERLRMVKPEYYGTDSQNRPFRIKAESAIQENQDAEKVSLNGIEAEMVLDGDVEVLSRAKQGVYYPDDKELGLLGDVIITTSNNYTIEAEDAAIDLEGRIVSSDMPVLGTGPHGRFEAKGFSADVEKEILSFTGGVRSVLDPKKAYTNPISDIEEKAQP